MTERWDCSRCSSYGLPAATTALRYVNEPQPIWGSYPHKKKRSEERYKLAGRWGFEPQIETSPITDFESAAFDHSAIFPYSLSICYPKLRAQLQQILSACAVRAALAFSRPGLDSSLPLITATVPVHPLYTKFKKKAIWK